METHEHSIPVVPLVDEHDGRWTYRPEIHRWALVGALVGAVAIGVLGWALASGALPVAGLGQWSSAGSAVGAFTGAGVGVALGALAGSLAALHRLERR